MKFNLVNIIMIGLTKKKSKRQNCILKEREEISIALLSKEQGQGIQVDHMHTFKLMSFSE